MADDVWIFYDDRMLEHQPPGWSPEDETPLSEEIRALLEQVGVPQGRWIHPERPERLRAVRDLLRASPMKGVAWKRARAARLRELARVHTREHVDYVESFRGRSGLLATDTTSVSPGSVAAARTAAGAAVGAADAVAAGAVRRAFALVRPPGHHAAADRVRGFCFYNNAAVAAAHVRAARGCERVLIVDWDAHHGNGTQAIFHADPDVLFFDVHRAPPYYPGTGALEETGEGAGEGTTLNVPLPDGAGDAALRIAFEQILVPAADRFRPDMVLVSAGFDGHRADLAMEISHAGFAAICRTVRDVADAHAGGRLALVLEGGYNPDALAVNARACLEVLADLPLTSPAAADEAPVDADEAPVDADEDRALEAVRHAVAFHDGGRRVPGR